MELRSAEAKYLVNVQPTDIVVVVATTIASVAGPSAAKVILRGTVPPTTNDYSFLAICRGLSPKDTAIIASQCFAMGGLCVIVCVCGGGGGGCLCLNQHIFQP